MKIIVLTGKGKPEASASEQAHKNIFLKKEPKLCLTFIHGTPQHHEVAEKAKDKKAKVVLFDEGFPADEVPGVISSVKKRMNGKSPKFFRYGIGSMEGVTHVERDSSEKILQGLL